MKKNPEVLATESGPSVVDAEKLIEQKEVESRWRKGLSSFWKIVIAVISVAFISYHLYTSRFGMPETIKHRAIYLGFVLVLVFLYFPASNKSPKGRPSVLDLILAVASLAATVYTIWSRDAFLIRAGVAVPHNIIVGGFYLLLVLEACRRSVGNQLLILVVIFLAYAYF